jgi:hypothetical protein
MKVFLISGLLLVENFVLVGIDATLPYIPWELENKLMKEMED